MTRKMLCYHKVTEEDRERMRAWLIADGVIPLDRVEGMLPPVGSKMGAPIEPVIDDEHHVCVPDIDWPRAGE